MYEAILGRESGLFPFDIEEVGIRRIRQDTVGWVKSHRRYDETMILLPDDRRLAAPVFCARLSDEHGFESAQAAETVRLLLDRVFPAQASDEVVEPGG